MRKTMMRLRATASTYPLPAEDFGVFAVIEQNAPKPIYTLADLVGNAAL